MIHVTKERIERSRKLIAKSSATPCNCPLAVSIKEETGCQWISVGVRNAMFSKDYVMHNVRLPKEARDFIATFELHPGAAVPLPFEFELEVNFA